VEKKIVHAALCQTLIGSAESRGRERDSSKSGVPSSRVLHRKKNDLKSSEGGGALLVA